MIIDKITSIWNAIYPHRQIILEDAKIKAKTTSSEEYHAKEMSDGERVTIYLLGQCLIAPNDMTIIIDEPEIHLHKSIMYRLWDKIEEFCPNKTFIYCIPLQVAIIGIPSPIQCFISFSSITSLYGCSSSL